MDVLKLFPRESTGRFSQQSIKINKEGIEIKD
jgi:hypothetical protein